MKVLEEQKLIDGWMIAPHRGEQGGKDHFHIYCEPTCSIDTTSYQFTEMFNQKVDGEDAPLGIMPWRKSKEDEWIAYAIHSKVYLDAKGEKKEYYDYPLDGIIADDPLRPLTAWNKVDLLKLLSPIEKIAFCLNEKMTVYQAMKVLRIPFAQMNSFQTMFYQLENEHIRTWKRSVEFNPNTCKKTVTYINTTSGEEVTEAEYLYRKEINRIEI